MNREIKFRGKNYENKWKYGDLVQEKWGQGKAIMIKKDTTAWSVLEDTVGQYTGLHDKNGKEIYEGDIVVDKEDEVMGEITWNEEEASFYFSILYENGTYEEEKLNDWASVLEVIGNIYDNPELLGGEDEC